jgi:taurine dioxygenase
MHMSADPVVAPSGGACGVIVHGVDAARPVDARLRRQLYALFLEHGLLVLRDQALTPEQHIAFSRTFGGLDPHPSENVRLAGYPEIYEVNYRSAPAADGEDQIIGQIPWHTDLTYTVRPSRGGLLYAREVPEEGGDTGFLDAAAAYDRLDDVTKRRIEHLEVVNSIDQVKQTAFRVDRSGAETGKQEPHPFPDVVLPLVVPHPQTGRRAINVSPSFTRCIRGLPAEESQSLVDQLIAHTARDDFAYFHSWRAGDLVIWDNWRMMHTARGYKAGYRRVMHRTTISPDYELGRLLDEAA